MLLSIINLGKKLQHLFYKKSQQIRGEIESLKQCAANMAPSYGRSFQKPHLKSDETLIR